MSLLATIRPELSEGVDQEIGLKLKRIFEQYRQCLRHIKKPWRPKNNKVTQTADSTEPPEPTPSDALIPEELAKKKQIMSWLAVGAQHVIRALERDELRLVLVWIAPQPPEIKRAILSLVASRGCPAVCLSDILTPVKSGWESLTSLTALGIKKSDVDTDFDEFVEYVRSVSPVIDIPAIPKFVPSSTEDNTETPKTTNTDSAYPSTSTSGDGTLPVQKSRKRDSGGGLRAHVQKATAPLVDINKYYRYRGEHSEKTFGDNFLQFDKADTIVVSFVNNKLVSVVGSEESIQAYSIASPVACVTVGWKPSVEHVDISNDDSESMEGVEVDTQTSKSGAKKMRKHNKKVMKNKYKSVNIKELKQKKRVKTNK